jgi:hypothetical protein
MQLTLAFSLLLNAFGSLAESWFVPPPGALSPNGLSRTVEDSIFKSLGLFSPEPEETGAKLNASFTREPQDALSLKPPTVKEEEAPPPKRFVRRRDDSHTMAQQYSSFMQVFPRAPPREEEALARGRHGTLADRKTKDKAKYQNLYNYGSAVKKHVTDLHTHLEEKNRKVPAWRQGKFAPGTFAAKFAADSGFEIDRIARKRGHVPHKPVYYHGPHMGLRRPGSLVQVTESGGISTINKAAQEVKRCCCRIIQKSSSMAMRQLMICLPLLFPQQDYTKIHPRSKISKMSHPVCLRSFVSNYAPIRNFLISTSGNTLSASFQTSLARQPLPSLPSLMI